MTPLSQAPQVFFSFVRKMFTYENGALIAFAAIPTYDLTKLFHLIFEGVPMKSIFMPFIIGAISMTVYVIVYTIDFLTGVRAARYKALKDPENRSPNWFKSDKGWSSIWKLCSIAMLICLNIPFCIAFVAMGFDTVDNVFLWAMLIISIAASLLDIISIGENHKKRYGHKPRIFTLLEDASKAFNEGIIKKAGNLLK